MSALDPQIANAVYRRDGFKCRHCGWRGDLHPHHVIFKSHQGKDTLDNLLAVCYICHRAIHDGFLEVIVLKLLPDNLIVKFKKLKGWIPR